MMDGHEWLDENIFDFLKIHPNYAGFLYTDTDKLYYCSKCFIYKRIINALRFKETLFIINDHYTKKFENLTCEEIQIKNLLE